MSSFERPIGGDFFWSAEGINRGTTISGRSTIRLILRSIDLKNKTILLPNYLCGVIYDVVRDFDVKVHFYKIDENFEASLESFSQENTVLYVIKYFGNTWDHIQWSIDHWTSDLIIDDVFGLGECPKHRTHPFYYFNSLRKISPVVGLSLLMSNQQIDQSPKVDISEYVSKRTMAMELKFNFILESRGDEFSYVSCFEQAEREMNQSRDIGKEDATSIHQAIEFFARIETERLIRKHNFDYAIELFPPTCNKKLKPIFPTFLPLFVCERDRVRAKLMENHIYLPVHWPNECSLDNSLYEDLISLPIDSRFSYDDYEAIHFLIRDYIKR